MFEFGVPGAGRVAVWVDADAEALVAAGDALAAGQPVAVVASAAAAFLVWGGPASGGVVPAGGFPCRWSEAGAVRGFAVVAPFDSRVVSVGPAAGGRAAILLEAAPLRV